MKSAGELILYKDFSGTDEEIFYPMASIIERSRRGGMDAKEERQKFYECFHQLMEVSASHGFQGNLWHNYLTYLLISNENAYSRACEIRGNIEGSINEIALHDFEVFRYFFEFDLEDLGRKLGVDCIPVLLHYERFEGNGKVFNSRIRDRICELSVKLEQTQSVSEFKDCVTEFYRDFGVGKLGLHKAFRVEHHENGAEIVPITNIAHVHLDDLVGYELAKKKLVENTEAFVEGTKIRYQMIVEDAALGSRFYGLIKSTDGGAHWQVVSSDPFGGQMGGSVEFTFLDEMFGFATLSHNGGDAAVLYVTEDGGKHYEQVEFAHKTYTDSIGNIVAPYDYPKMPYEKDGVIYVLCGQGADGDYDGGDSLHLARYRSEDYGHSFVFDTLVDGTSEG